jgi:hypothetical protein
MRLSATQKAIQVLSDNDPGLSYLYESMANNYIPSNRKPLSILEVLELIPSSSADEIQLRMAVAIAILQLQDGAETYEKI